MNRSLYLTRVNRSVRFFLLASACILFAEKSMAQTAFVDFNTVGEYTNNFNPWNDAGGVNGGNYSFEESTNDGVGGSGGVAVYQNTDMTATYKSASWNLATNGATVIVSLLIYTDGQTGNKVQLGVANSTANGLNANAGVDFESFRFIPNGTTTWPLFEQSCVNGATAAGNGGAAYGTVTVEVGHWYKFVVAMTNTSGASGNLSSGCALYDYGTDGLTPGANLITFSTVIAHTGLAIAQSTAVWPALRTSSGQASGISAWDDFLVYQSNSPPAITLTLTNSVIASGSSATFSALADGPGTITYAWYTNKTLAAGATGTSYTTLPVTTALTNVMVVAKNAYGSATNSAAVGVIVAQPPQIESTAATAVGDASATLGGQILSTGGITTTVNLYYGTTDGGTNAAAWANVVPLGAQTGVFSQTVTLIPSNTYYFTVEASNGAGVAWATPSRSFTTSDGATTISFDNGTGWSVNQSGITTANISGNVLTGTDGNGGEWVTAWYNTEAYINGFTASFTYQNVNGSPGSDADGASFDLQESGRIWRQPGNL
jgi:hypothetical protein